MRTRLLYTLFVIMSLCLTGCTDDLLLDDKPFSLDEGELSEATISIRVSELAVGEQQSRAENIIYTDIEATVEEKQIDNFWLFQFDKTSGLPLIIPRYYTIEDQSQLTNLKVLLKENVESTLYVVTNTNDPDWKNKINFSTFSIFKTQVIPNPEPQFSGGLSIPMSGTKEVNIENLSETINIEVERMFARLDINLSIEVNTLALQSILVSKIPWDCKVSTRYAGNSEPADYPSEAFYWISRGWNAKDLTHSEGVYQTVSIYIPENIQGEIAGLTTQDEKFENAPSCALNVIFNVTYTEPGTGAETEYPYIVYPGGNGYDNYNIRRNCIYRVNVRIQHDDEVINHHIPSSNCMVTEPNKTISFEPYYRVEIGGNYNFKDYLDPDDKDYSDPADSDGLKVIKRVGIIWQTTGTVSINGDASQTVIGDNRNGDKVWYNPTNQKIYVKTRGSGNALIAAYNKKGDIIWSWHIWSTTMQPNNPGNAIVYSTYNWDGTGIKSANRVPGYAVMRCNLGALADDPTNNRNQWFQTWGMYYQWGRKDPFPPVRTATEVMPWASEDLPTPDGLSPIRTHPYDHQHVTALFDNENERIYGITEKEKSDENDLFYTYSVWKEGTDYGIEYSIANPTVFMSGMTTSGTFDIGTPPNESCNVETGDWMRNPDNKLWGGIDPDEVSTYLEVSPVNTIYKNYGPYKTIFDPCPTGWRVPPDDLWMSFTKTGYNPTMLYRGYPHQTAQDVNFDASRNIADDSNNQGPGLWMYMQQWKSGPTLFFPTQGVRRPLGHITRVLMCGSYMSANAGKKITSGVGAGNNNINSLHMHYPRTTDWDDLYYMTYEYANSIYRSKSTAGAVRCVRDTY